MNEENINTLKYYNYNIKKSLKTDSDDINLGLYQTLHICCYEICNESVEPFLKFLLTPNIRFSLSFPQIIIIDLPMEYLLEEVKMNLVNLLNVNNIQLFEDKLVVNGFYEYNNELYLFLDITECKIVINDVYSTSDAWMAIIDEIINLKKICNLNIDDKPYTFFNNNPDFCVLLNENEEPYETPLALFVGKGENKLNFTYVFGETAKNKDAILGPFYYFTNFQNAVKEGYELNNEKNTKCGIVRFAIFIGKTKYIENLPNDEIDQSEIKRGRLLDSELNILKEQLTMRISDHDGKWSEKYDSCYLGKLMLDNGLYLEGMPHFVIKNYNQQFPLSYHFINKNNLNNII